MTSHIQDILFPYQKEDVARFHQDIPRGIIGSDMGTGKTEEFLAICDILQASRVLIVATKTMVLEWKARIALRLGEVAGVPDGVEEGKYTRYSLSLEHFKNFRYLIINHEMLRMERYIKVLKLIPWDVIGIDEAHRFTNHRARHPNQKRVRGPKGSRQVWGARQLATISTRFYWITGTPFLNYPDELWGLLHLLYPEQYPNYYTFVGDYCITVPTHWGFRVVGPRKQRTEELREKLHAVMIRHEKSEVMPWLVKLPPRDIPLQMSGPQLQVYQEMEVDFVAHLRSGIDLFAKSSLAQLMRLRQIALDPAILGIEAPSAKTTALLDILKDLNQSIVVFSWFSSYLNYLYGLLDQDECSIITGLQDTAERHRTIKHFQAGKSRILLASIKAGGEGIDLTAASVCLFTDVTWVPGDSKQAEDRLHRYGQTSAVTVLRLLHPNTIDEDMHKVNKRKAKAFTEIVAIREAIDSMTQRQQVGVLT
ncbi:hypothetical protein LCGC14_0730830 [marine sediment metagenome]|uniref:Helicase ATP-binding domain-containing protein n=1 Tax=marine sediment metagenome TaxID=412755 RepID=A0A0F9QDQ6_9ZZZZ